MHKTTSKRTGGSTLSGWSTAKPTEPTDYRTGALGRAEAKRKAAKSHYARVRRKFRAIVLKCARESKPAPTVIPVVLQAEIAAAGGVEQWAIGLALEASPVKQRPFPRSGTRFMP